MKSQADMTLANVTTLGRDRFTNIGLVWRGVVCGSLAAMLATLLAWLGWLLFDAWLWPLAPAAGALVGLGVRFGTKACGGWLYQALAVGLASLAISIGRLPVSAWNQADGMNAQALLVFLLTQPFYRDGSTLESAAVIFGLLQAAYWNRKRKVETAIDTRIA